MSARSSVKPEHLQRRPRLECCNGSDSCPIACHTQSRKACRSSSSSVVAAARTSPSSGAVGRRGAQLHAAHVANDRPQPCTGCLQFAQVVEAAECREHRVLNGIIGGGAVAQPCDGHCPHVGPVPLQEQPEAGRVPRPRRLDQLPVTGRRSVHHGSCTQEGGARSPERQRWLVAHLRRSAVEQLDDDALFGLGLRRASATPTGCPTGEVRRCRPAVVLETRVGTSAQQRRDGSRASVSDRSMQRRHSASRGRVGVSARFDEVEDDRPLLRRVPVGRPGHTDHRRVERFGTPPVPCPDVRTAGDELPCHPGVVAEGRGMERRVAFVDLCQALGQEELIASSQACRHQRRSLVEKSQRSSLVARRDRCQQPGQVAHSRRLSLMEAVRTTSNPDSFTTQ